VLFKYFNFKQLDFNYQDGFKQSLVYENVLVLRLDHVVPLRAQAGDVTVDVDGLLVLQSLQHRIDHYECSRSTDSGTARKNMSSMLLRLKVIELQNWLSG